MLYNPLKEQITRNIKIPLYYTGLTTSATISEKGKNPEIDSYSGFQDNNHFMKTGLDDFLKYHDIQLLEVVGLASAWPAEDQVGLSEALPADARLLVGRVELEVDNEAADPEGTLVGGLSHGVEVVGGPKG